MTAAATPDERSGPSLAATVGPPFAHTPWLRDQPQVTTKGEWRWWMRQVRDAPVRPDRLTRLQRARLGDAARDEYDQARLTYHSRFGPIRHRDFVDIHDEILELAEDNWLTRSATAWPCALIDGQASLGKSTLAMYIGYVYERRMRDHYGLAGTTVPDDYVPVLICTLDSAMTVKALDRSLATFYGPPKHSRSADEYRHLVLECARRCGTTLVILDDLHNLLPRRRNHDEVSGHIKCLMNQLPATFVYVGINCTVLLNDGHDTHQLHLAQNSSRAHVYSLELYPLETHEDLQEWTSLVASFTSHLVLGEAPTDLWKKHAVYLHRRTNGQMNALQMLLRRSANRAIRNGTEKIDRHLLDSIKLPKTSETHAWAVGWRPRRGTRNARVDRRSQGPAAR
ncbi:MAG: TniB family NTP-binding protein [Solirubrobacteraceae bacterium]